MTEKHFSMCQSKAWTEACSGKYSRKMGAISRKRPLEVKQGIHIQCELSPEGKTAMVWRLNIYNGRLPGAEIEPE